jgi:hypothetical protein
MSNTPKKMSRQREHITIAQKELGNYLDQVKDEERARARNNSLLYLLAMLSLCGLFYVLFIKSPTQNNSFYPTIYTHNPPDVLINKAEQKQNSKKALASVLPNDKDAVSAVAVLPASFAIIGGEKEANEVINFSFSNLMKEHQYVLDLGNGSMLDVHSSSSSYAYKKDGIYKISLKVKANNVYNTLYSQDVKILPSIEVEPINISVKN